MRLCWLSLTFFYVGSELKSDVGPIKYKSAQHEAMSAQSNILYIYIYVGSELKSDAGPIKYKSAHI